MDWKGAFFGAVLGLLFTRGHVLGAVFGALAGMWLEQNRGSFGAFAAGGARSAATVSEVFFRATFELMGQVAKSDGRVSEAEIGAARQVMQELSLGAHEVGVAIGCFTAGKSAAFDVNACIEELRMACGPRHDLKRAFMELQLRAALAGNGLSPPARGILMRVAERLGLEALEFAYMESVMRARRPAGTGHAGRQSAGGRNLSVCYAELEVDASKSDREVTKAYRRQMSRHHPDKLVANGLPESMTQLAKERTQRIQEAYETIRAARGMR